MKLYNRLSWDAIGFSVSALCAVHCFVVPLLLAFTAAGWMAVLENERIENVVLAFSAALGFISLVPSYKKHKQAKALLFFVIGIISIGLGRWPVNEVWEILTTTIGAAFVASAHFINHSCSMAVEPEAPNTI